MGLREQAMHQRLRPLDENACVFAGRARTVQWMSTEYVVSPHPYGKEIDIMDDLKPGDVVVHSTDYARANAPWGELMSTIAKYRGAVGCICDSQIRDVARIRAMGFPVFYAGIRPVDSKGRGYVVDYDVPVRSGGVVVNAGDLIFADLDGVVVIPRGKEEEVIRRAAEKAKAEDLSRMELLQGKSLREVYDRYGAL
ncbi:MAG: RraA family protein [Clostridiales bacterium]|nr:RraA family protein [Clostridiales bacterium]